MKKEFYQGKVKQYNPDKGFGFIATAEGEIFFHIRTYALTCKFLQKGRD